MSQKRSRRGSFPRR